MPSLLLPILAVIAPMMPMPDGPLTDAPAGYVAMCARDPGACAQPESAATLPLSQSEQTKLVNKVNRSVNSRIAWQADAVERWERPTGSRPRGDCEDFAIEKRAELIAAGFPANRLFFAVGYMRGAGLHAVLVASTDDGDLVLDSLSQWALPWQKASITWLLRQSQTTPSQWNRVGPVIQTAEKAGPANS